MNGTGFGFPTYPQRPSVKPQQVGAALQQMQQATNPPFDATQALVRGNPGDPALFGTPQSAGVRRSFIEALRRLPANVGRELRGQSPDLPPRVAPPSMPARPAIPGFAADATAVAHQAPATTPPRFSQPSHAPNGAPQQDPDPDPAIKMAVHEAMQRQASGGASPGQQGDGNPNNAEQLRRLGLSPLEIRLLGMSGGARF